MGASSTPKYPEKLAQASFPVESKTVRLAPGMAVRVELKTGKRRLIEYFLIR